MTCLVAGKSSRPRRPGAVTATQRQGINGAGSPARLASSMAFWAAWASSVRARRRAIAVSRSHTNGANEMPFAKEISGQMESNSLQRGS